MSRSRAFDVLIVGGGPAAMAAACAAAEGGRSVGVVDDHPTLGGQIWHGRSRKADDKQAAVWFDKIRRANVEFLAETQIVDRPAEGRLRAETAQGACQLQYEKLIVATGARELLLPFPGWTLPGVTGAGGLQALVKSGFPIGGKKVVVAGSGPLLLATAAYLRRHGAEIRLIAEQAPWGRLTRFGLGLVGTPRKLLQGLGYKLELRGVRYTAGCWPLEAVGDDKLASVTFRTGNKTRTLRCDYLACGFGFVPNLELPALLGCELESTAVRTDPWQETSVPGVYAAGEATGIGGAELALIEGRIAGYAVAGQSEQAARLFGARRRARRFAAALARAFALREELKSLATAETIVCRCEDVSRGRLEPHRSWRAAKLQTRCGMGPCQGRICGAAAEFLFGFKSESVRPPIFPTRLENLVDRQFDTLSKPGQR